MLCNVSHLRSLVTRGASGARSFSTGMLSRPNFPAVFSCHQKLFSVRAFSANACQGPVNISQLVGQEMPAFKTSAVVDGSVKDFDVQEYLKGSYGLLVFYPLDFTFVCPSELLGISSRIKEFSDRGVKVAGVSVDSVFSHLSWSQLELKKGGIEGIKFPLVSDLSRSITKSFGLLRAEGFSQRASVLVDKAGKIRHVAIYDLGIGRSVDEMLRMFDAIKHCDEHGEVCPASWEKGKPAMNATAESTGEYLDKVYKP